jgi:hypothetical protein
MATTGKGGRNHRNVRGVPYGIRASGKRDNLLGNNQGWNARLKIVHRAEGYLIEIELTGHSFITDF